jgi:hypothetical protein
MVVVPCWSQSKRPDSRRHEAGNREVEGFCRGICSSLLGSEGRRRRRRSALGLARGRRVGCFPFVVASCVSEKSEGEKK